MALSSSQRTSMGPPGCCGHGPARKMQLVLGCEGSGREERKGLEPRALGLPAPRPSSVSPTHTSCASHAGQIGARAVQSVSEMGLCLVRAGGWDEGMDKELEAWIGGCGGE